MKYTDIFTSRLSLTMHESLQPQYEKKPLIGTAVRGFCSSELASKSSVRSAMEKAMSLSVEANVQGYKVGHAGRSTSMTVLYIIVHMGCDCI